MDNYQLVFLFPDPFQAQKLPGGGSLGRKQRIYIDASKSSLTGGVSLPHGSSLILINKHLPRQSEYFSKMITIYGKCYGIDHQIRAHKQGPYQKFPVFNSAPVEYPYYKN